MSSSVFSSFRFILEVLPAWVGPFEDEHAQCGLVPHLFRTILRYPAADPTPVWEVAKQLSNVIIPAAQNQHAKLQAFLAATGSNQMADGSVGNSGACCYPACTTLAPREKYHDLMVQIPGIGYARPYVFVLKNSFLPLGSFFNEDVHEDETVVLRPMTLSELKEGVLDNYLVWVGQYLIATAHDQGVYEATCSWRQALLNEGVVEIPDFDLLARTIDNLYNDEGRKIAPPPGLPIPKALLDRQLEIESTVAVVELSGEDTAIRGRSPTQNLHPNGGFGSVANKRVVSENWRVNLEERGGWPPVAPSPKDLPPPTFLKNKKQNGMPSIESNVTPKTPTQPTSVAAASTAGSSVSSSSKGKSRFSDLFAQMEAKAKAQASAGVVSVSNLDEGNQTKWMVEDVDVETANRPGLLPPAEIVPGRNYRRQSTPTIQQKPAAFMGFMFPCGGLGMPVSCDGGDYDPEALQAQVEPFMAVIKSRANTWPGAYPDYYSAGIDSGGSPHSDALTIPISPEHFRSRVFGGGVEVVEYDDEDDIEQFYTPTSNNLEKEFPIYNPSCPVSDEENDADQEDEDDEEFTDGDVVYCDACDYDDSKEEEEEEEEQASSDDDSHDSEDDDTVDLVSGGVAIKSPFNVFLTCERLDAKLRQGLSEVRTITGCFQLDGAGLPVPCY